MHIETYTMDIYGYCACVVVCVFDLKILACRPCKYPLGHFPAKIISWYQLLSESSPWPKRCPWYFRRGTLSLSPSLHRHLREFRNVQKLKATTNQDLIATKTPWFLCTFSLSSTIWRSSMEEVGSPFTTSLRVGGVFASFNHVHPIVVGDRHPRILFCLQKWYPKIWWLMMII